MIDFTIKFIIGGIIVIGIAIIMSIERKKRNKPIHTNKSTNYNKAKQKFETLKDKEIKPISNWIFAFPIIVFFLWTIIYDKLDKNENIQVAQVNQNQTTITRAPTPEEEKKYIDENSIIKLGNEYHWNGIRESDEILPVTKALDLGCQNDFCRIEKYFDYVKNIPYEKGTPNQDKNAVEVMKKWKGDCDERAGLLASMMIANGYKIILVYSEGHTFAAVNIPNYETEERRSYFEYKNEKYYWAETTDQRAVIGAYNGIEGKKLKFAYNANEKKEIPLNELQANIYL